MVKAG